MKIKYLKNKEIDYVAWDKTITDSHNSTIYAYSWYLDIVSPNWEALILGDYDYVMPLTVRRKYGLKFIAQPPLTQQLGVFSQKPIDEEIIHEFIRKIPFFSYHINLNQGNKILEAEPLPNYILDLSFKYENIASNYSKNHLSNIRKAKKNNILIKSDLSLDIFFNFYFNVQGKDFKLPAKEFIIKLITTAVNKNSVINYGAYSEKGELIGVLSLLKSKKKLIVLLSYLNISGRKLSAMYLLIDEIIRHYSEKNCILDFEGSRLEGIAYFKKGFGAIYEPYFQIKKHSVVSLVEKLRK